MLQLPPSIQRVIEEFNKLPGIGHKTSERFIFHLLKQPRTSLGGFAQALEQLREKIIVCQACFNFSEQNPCLLCSDPRRSPETLCVVAESVDVFALEKSGVFPGRYHVLGGNIQQMDGIGPQQLRIRELVARAKSGTVKEIILALNPDLEGETTALYLLQVLRETPLKITRLAQGLPTGSNIEYADELTLSKAFEGRR